MGTFDYLDRRPHKPSTGGGGTVYVHTDPVEIIYKKRQIVVDHSEPIIEVEYQGEDE